MEELLYSEWHLKVLISTTAVRSAEYLDGGEQNDQFSCVKIVVKVLLRASSGPVVISVPLLLIFTLSPHQPPPHHPTSWLSRISEKSALNISACRRDTRTQSIHVWRWDLMSVFCFIASLLGQTGPRLES